MITKEENSLRWLEFELLSEFKNLQSGVFLRQGGHSEGPYESLNLSHNVNDLKESAEANRKKVSEFIKAPIVPMGGCHGHEVKRVFTSVWDQEFHCDALSTDLTNICLLVTHADCQAAIFYDPIHHVVSNVHCGWRGNVQNIYAHAIDHMQANYGSSPKDLLVCISPSLGPDDAEFIHYEIELPKHFWNYQIKPKYFDLWAISQSQLEDKGILPHHIQIARINTFAHPQDYFSYRRDKTCGRNATFAVLRN